jgi:FkbM family methyltransferase
MLSKISEKIYRLSRFIEYPILFKLRKEGGIAETYEKLNTLWFKSLEIDTVLDIGANTGQFTKTILTLLPNSRIYSFEPLPDCFKELQQFTNGYSNITAFNIGVGAISGSLSFEENEFSPSSSFLKMADTHKQAYAYTKNTKTVEVKIDRLDDLSKDFNLGSSLLIKIDVQGYEDKVLQGGMNTIQQAKIIIIETSFVHLYESQPLFNDIYSVFRDWGFNYFGMIDQASDPKTGQILQGDAIFIKA